MSCKDGTNTVNGWPCTTGWFLSKLLLKDCYIQTDTKAQSRHVWQPLDVTQITFTNTPKISFEIFCLSYRQTSIKFMIILYLPVLGEKAVRSMILKQWCQVIQTASPLTDLNCFRCSVQNMQWYNNSCLISCISSVFFPFSQTFTAGAVTSFIMADSTNILEQPAVRGHLIKRSCLLCSSNT